MGKIICNSLDYIFTEDVELFTIDQVRLKKGRSWKKLHVKEKPAYTSSIDIENAGPLSKETVTAVTPFNHDIFLKQHTSFGVILRMKTDVGIFYVGSQKYPCTTEVSSDQINDTYTFSVTSIP